MLKAKDIMTTEPTVLRPEYEIASAVSTLLSMKVNGLPVVDDEGKVIGVLCQSDLVAQQKKLPLPSFFTLLDGFINLGNEDELEGELKKMTALTVEAAMTANPYTVSPDTGVDEIATVMTEKRYYTIPVVEDGKLVGVIGEEDILRTLVQK